MYPVIIGGSGGSGTRVVAQICYELGFYMGALSYAFDAKDLELFFNLWTKRYLRDSYIVGLDTEFHSYITKFFSINLSEKWGFKITRSMFFLPFFNNLFPVMRYIHVVRDGRDMPFSQNHRQPRELFDVFFERAWQQKTVFEDAARFWNKVNLMAYRTGKEILNERFLLVKLEDLCFDKYNTLTNLLTFLQVDGDVEELSKLIKNPKTFGRYKGHPELIEIITDLTREGLEEFGYE